MRIAAQKPSSFFAAGCDHVLNNDGDDPRAFEQQARTLFQTIISQGEL
jgi:hypothetical protein